MTHIKFTPAPGPWIGEPLPARSAATPSYAPETTPAPSPRSELPAPAHPAGHGVATDVYGAHPEHRDLLALSPTVSPRAERGNRAQALVGYTDPESAKRLSQARAKRAFFHLSTQFEAQSNTAFCGVTSAVIILNALRAGTDIEAPVVHFEHDELARKRWFERDDTPYINRYAQSNLFSDPAVAKVKTYDETLGRPRHRGGPNDIGLSLEELDGILKAERLSTRRRIASPQLTGRQIKDEIADALGRDGHYVIINYDRSVIGQHGGGHFSPLGAYDEVSDSFLIMDVNTEYRDWVWAPADLVVASLRPWRGYILVEEGLHGQAGAPAHEDTAPSAPPWPSGQESPQVESALEEAQGASAGGRGALHGATAERPRSGKLGIIDRERRAHRALLEALDAPVSELVDAAWFELKNLEDLPLALALVERACVDAPQFPGALALRQQCRSAVSEARACAEELELTPRGEPREVYLAGLAKRPDAPGPHTLFQLGRRALDEGLNAAAVLLFDRVEREGRGLELAVLWPDYAAAAGRAGLPEKALEKLEAALEDAPHEPLLHVGRAWAHGEIARNLLHDPRSTSRAAKAAQEAQRGFQRALDYAPNDAIRAVVREAERALTTAPDAATACASAERAWSEGDLEGATRAFQEARLLAPHDADIELSLASLAFLRGVPSEALKHLRRALELGLPRDVRVDVRANIAVAQWDLAREARARGHRSGFDFWRRRALAEIDLALKEAPHRDDVMANRRVIERAVFETPPQRR